MRNKLVVRKRELVRCACGEIATHIVQYWDYNNLSTISIDGKLTTTATESHNSCAKCVVRIAQSIFESQGLLVN